MTTSRCTSGLGLSFDDRAIQDAGFVHGVEIGGRVERATIASDHQIVLPPFVQIDKAVPGRKVDQVVEKLTTFQVWNALNLSGMAAAIDRFPAGHRIHSRERVTGGARRISSAVASRPPPARRKYSIEWIGCKPSMRLFTVSVEAS